MNPAQSRPCSSSRRRGGALKKVLIGLLAFTVLVVVAWIVFLPTIVRQQVERRTGFPLEASTISVNPFGARVLLEGVHLRNPAGFPSPDFVDLKRFEVLVKPLSLSGGRVEIPRLDLDIEKITVVTDAKGVSNVSLFNQRASGTPAGETAPKDAPPEPAREFLIGELHIRIATVETIDHSRGGEPVVRTINLGVDRTFQNVSDPKVVIAPILTDVARANVEGITGALGTLLPKNEKGEKLRETGAKVGESLKKLFDSAPGTSKP